LDLSIYQMNRNSLEERFFIIQNHFYHIIKIQLHQNVLHHHHRWQILLILYFTRYLHMLRFYLLISNFLFG